jgi:hypothetical protein
VLGQQATEEKSNEITAIPMLLKHLDLKGALVTMDAMGTQTDIARAIRDGGGDYCMSLKKNWPAVHAEVEQPPALGAGRDLPRRPRTLPDRRRAAKHGNHPPHNPQSPLTSQTNHQSEEPPQTRRLERRLSRNRHSADRLTFKRFPCPTGAEALEGPFSAFPSRFLLVECGRCGKVQLVNQAPADPRHPQQDAPRRLRWPGWW